MNPEMDEAVDFLYGLPRFTKKNSLAHTRKLIRLLGDPCADRRVIHVAGTNGKGSVCNFLYHMLLAGGAGAAMFTSPHLTDIRERFQVNGQFVREEDFLAAFDRVAGAVQCLTESGEPHPTFFEYLYAIALVLFEGAPAEYLILETGLGGRLDATNCFPTPVLTVITPVSLEHTEILGDTIGQIAAEKAGILKSGVPVVYAADDEEAADVIAARAEALGCPAIAVRIDRSPEPAEVKRAVWKIPGHALYQAENAALALEAMRVLRRMAEKDGTLQPCRMDDATLQQGLSEASWPGRMQEVLPDLYFDGAHNPAGIEAFLRSVEALSGEDPVPPMLLFAMAEDKEIGTAAGLLLAGMDWDTVAVTAVPGERGADAERTAAFFAEAGRERSERGENGAKSAGRTPEVYDDCREAFRIMRERKREGQKLFCTGSLYLIGALTEMLEEDSGGRYGF